MKRIIYCELMNDNIGRPYLDVKKFTGGVPTRGLKVRPGEAGGDGSGELGGDGSIKYSLLLTKTASAGMPSGGAVAVDGVDSEGDGEGDFFADMGCFLLGEQSNLLGGGRCSSYSVANATLHTRFVGINEVEHGGEGRDRGRGDTPSSMVGRRGSSCGEGELVDDS